MFQSGSIHSPLNLRDKIQAIDPILILSVLILGIISLFAMYSTDGGQFAYHTKSHIVRFFLFFLLFLVCSFLQKSFWYSSKGRYCFKGYKVAIS